MERKYTRFSPEAVQLACNVIGQCGGDTGKARRSLAEAHAWTCSPDIDPSWKQEAGEGKGEGTVDPAIVKLGAALTERANELNGERAAHGETRKALERAASELLAVKADLAKCRSALQDTLTPAPAKPAAVQVDKPAQKASPVVKADPAPAPVAADDPYADLPPNLREWARKRDAANRKTSNLEID